MLQLLALILVLYAAYRGVLLVWRLRFHPLAKFPGPRAAAVSDRWLYALSKAGHPEAEFDKLHRDFGKKTSPLESSRISVPSWACKGLFQPVADRINVGTQALRIGPNELHITDVSLYKVIYSQRNPYLKVSEFYAGFNTPHTLFAESDPALHKERRRLLNPFFSKAGITKVESMVFDKARRLQKKLSALSAPGRQHLINAGNAFRSLTVDLITEYAFAKSKMLIENSDDNFASPTLQGLDAATVGLWDSIYQPAMRKTANLIPTALVSALSKELAALFNIIHEAKDSYEDYKKTGKRELPVIFDAMKVVPDDQQVVAEAIDILVAGSDTTAFTLTCGIWHISRNAHIQRKLTEALAEALPGREEPSSLLQLESIPYLGACVRECLRMAMPVPGRLPRIVPGAGHEPLVVDGQVVPPGTVVGISAYTMHRSEELWGSDALDFNPDRWLGEEGKHLESYLVTFSKGLRSCIGQNLAFAELYATIAMLYGNFEIQVDPTSQSFGGVDYFTQQVPEPGLLLRMKELN